MSTIIVSPPAESVGADAIKHRVGVGSAIAVHDSLIASCDVADIGDYTQIGVKPSANITTLTFHAAETAGGTYVLIDSIGTAGVVTVVASKWNTLDPAKIGPYRFIKALGNVAGTIVIIGKT